MLYKVGDKVRVRQRKAMERTGNYLPEHTWADRFFGKVVTIQSIEDGYYKIQEDDGFNFWTDSMFESLAFEYGEEIGVSDLSNAWTDKTSIFVGYIDGAEKPFQCVAGWSETNFKNGERYGVFPWEFARKLTVKIPPKEEKKLDIIISKQITVNGKQLSPEEAIREINKMRGN